MVAGYLLISLALKLIALDQNITGLIGLILGVKPAAGGAFHWAGVLDVASGTAGGFIVLWALGAARNPSKIAEFLWSKLEHNPGSLLMWCGGLYAIVGGLAVGCQMLLVRYVPFDDGLSEYYKTVAYSNL